MKRALFAVLCAGTILTAIPANAGEGFGGGPSACDMAPGPRLERCQSWIQIVQRPDNRGASCCGIGDSAIVDDFKRGPNGELIAVVTAVYPETPGYQQDDGSIMPPGFSLHKGDEIVIPPEKVNSLPEDANRSSHGVVFLKPSTGEVLCYFFPPLT